MDEIITLLKALPKTTEIYLSYKRGRIMLTLQKPIAGNKWVINKTYSIEALKQMHDPLIVIMDQIREFQNT